MKPYIFLAVPCVLAFQPFPPSTELGKTIVRGTPFNTVDVGSGLASGDKTQAGLSGTSIFERATADFGRRYPAAFKRGLGPTTKAERWNGRHAMAGWVLLLLTGYAQSRGLLPQGQLDPKEWGTWVIVATENGVPRTIPLERATILVAHLHLAAVGVFAAFNKDSVKDRLLLEPGEKDDAPAGLFVPFKLGLTKDAELLNGRIAMLGLVSLLAASAYQQKPVLDVISTCTGGVIF